jgi:hypothetical protein
MANNSILSIPSHGQHNDPTVPSVFTPLQDAFGKMRPFPASPNPGTDRIAETPKK